MEYCLTKLSHIELCAMRRSQREKGAGFLDYYDVIANIKKNLKEGDFYCNLGKGDVERSIYPTPKQFTDIVKFTLDKQYFNYSHPLGRKDTRSILAHYNNLLGGFDHYSAENISIIGSFSFGLHAILSILKKKYKLKKSLISSPTFLTHIDLLNYHKISVSSISTETNEERLFDCDEFLKAVTPDIGLIILCIPNFPFGRFMAKSELLKIVEYCEKNDIFIILDHAFEDVYLVNDIPTIYDDIYSENIIRIYNYSKNLGVPGFRIGHLIANNDIIKYLENFLELTFGSPPTIFETLIDYYTLAKIKHRFGNESFYKSIDLLKEEEKIDIFKQSQLDWTGGLDTLNKYYKSYKNNYSVIKNLLSDEDHYHLIEPLAGINMGMQIKIKKNSKDLFKEIGLNTGVILSPGEAFNMNDTEYPWYRITLSNDPVMIEKSMERMTTYLESNYWK